MLVRTPWRTWRAGMLATQRDLGLAAGYAAFSLHVKQRGVGCRAPALGNGKYPYFDALVAPRQLEHIAGTHGSGGFDGVPVEIDLTAIDRLPGDRTRLVHARSPKPHVGTYHTIFSGRAGRHRIIINKALPAVMVSNDNAMPAPSTVFPSRGSRLY